MQIMYIVGIITLYITFHRQTQGGANGDEANDIGRKIQDGKEGIV